MERNQCIDTLKGAMILCVVVGHSFNGTLHEIIFLFHMPIFFLISGFLIDKKKLLERHYIKRKIESLMIPYVCYSIIDLFVFRAGLSMRIVRLMWGGRIMPGVYWYVTCFLFSLAVFSFMLEHFSDGICKRLIFVGGFIAVLESCILSGKLRDIFSLNAPLLARICELMDTPGIPWNLDVALLALVYISIGYYNKDRIKRFMSSNKKLYDYFAAGLVIVIAIFCFVNYRGEEPIYHFDMKNVYYHDLLLAVLIPCTFGFIFLRLDRVIRRRNKVAVLLSTFSFLGRMTVPIMFMHMPLNAFREMLGYGGVTYVLIGIGMPCIFTLLFNRYKVARALFGLPRIKELKITM